MPTNRLPLGIGRMDPSRSTPFGGSATTGPIAAQFPPSLTGGEGATAHPISYTPSAPAQTDWMQGVMERNQLRGQGRNRLF